MESCAPYGNFNAQSLHLSVIGTYQGSRVAIRSSDSVERCSFYLTGRRKKTQNLPFITSQGKNKTFMCFCAKKTHLTVHTDADTSTVLSLVPAFNLREGWCVFGFLKYVNAKVDFRRVCSISALAFPQASYLWSMLTFEICGHTAGQVIDPRCRRRRELHVIPPDETALSPRGEVQGVHVLNEIQ